MTNDSKVSQALLTNTSNAHAENVSIGTHIAENPVPAVETKTLGGSGEKSSGESIVKVYKRRWYVLIVFGLYTFTQSMVCNTWSPISTSSEEAFGWDTSVIAWITNWAPISYILTGLFFPWLLQAKGLKWATLISMVFVVVGTSFRVITSEPFTATILIHFGHFLNGIAGPVAMSAMPTLSATWFPPKERVTATAIGTSLCEFGNAIAFVIGPALVSDIHTDKAYRTNITSSTHNQSFLFDELSDDNVTDTRIHKERQQIMKYMYFVCGLSGAVFVIMLVYFPAKPPHPPCVSASVEREKYWTGMGSLRHKGYFLLLALVYSVSIGILIVWNSVLNLNLRPTGVSEVTAGWIGFYSTITSCTVSMLIGRFADHFVRRMKVFILIMYSLSMCCFVVIALVMQKVIPVYEAVLYLTVIGGSTLLSATVPMLYELACELAYPVSEGAANGFMTFFNNLCGLIFLAIFSIPNIGTNWMNWTIITSTAVCIPLIVLIKGRFNRLEVDEGAPRKACVQQELIVSQ